MRSLKRILVLLLLQTVALAALADEHGRKELADESNIKSGPLVNESYEYYEVTGNCEKDLQNQIKQKSPEWSDGQRYDSLTSWSLKCDHSCQLKPGGCSCGWLKVVLDIVYHYPKWIYAGDVSPQLINKWNLYLKNLAIHENGHRDIAIREAAQLLHELAEIPPAQNCSELERKVRSLNLEHVKKARELQNGYDISTSHGLSQGAIFQ